MANKHRAQLLRISYPAGRYDFFLGDCETMPFSKPNVDKEGLL